MSALCIIYAYMNAYMLMHIYKLIEVKGVHHFTDGA